MSPSDHDPVPASSTFDQESPPAEPAPGEGAPVPSVWQRAARVFIGPERAWVGLETRSRWWFPLVILTVISATLMILTFHRIMVPMQMEQFNRMVESGQMPAAQLDKIEAKFATDPGIVALFVGGQVIVSWLIYLLLGLLAWFAVGFVLGGKISYRLSLEVVCWGSLVSLPQTLLTYGIGWMNETFKGIHFGLGALLPPEETPTKLHGALGVLLDAVGPFNLWYLFVAVVGCSVLSGAPRKSVAWVLAGLYVALTVVFALVAGVFGQGA